MNFYDPVHLISAAHRGLFKADGERFYKNRTPDPNAITDAAKKTPPICANISTPAEMMACLDAYCGNKSPHGALSSSFKFDRFWGAWQSAIKSGHLFGINPRAALSTMLDGNEKDLCEDRTPPPGAVATVPSLGRGPVDLPDEEPVRIGNCGFATSVPPEANGTWSIFLASLLVFLAFRGAPPPATGSFFLSTTPKGGDYSDDRS